jgi:hypothetical protein
MEQKDGGRPRPSRPEVPGLAPVRAFLLVCVLATAAGGLLFATRDASPSEPPRGPARSPDYTLTEAEAIAEFERLNAQLMQAYEERNIALAEDVFTSDSPMLPRVRKEIRTLAEEHVVSRTRFRLVSINVTSTTPSETLITRVQIVHPHFETEQGVDVTDTTSAERQRSEWILRVERGRWLLHDATITRISS